MVWSVAVWGAGKWGESDWSPQSTHILDLIIVEMEKVDPTGWFERVIVDMQKAT